MQYLNTEFLNRVETYNMRDYIAEWSEFARNGYLCKIVDVISHNSIFYASTLGCFNSNTWYSHNVIL